MFPTRIPVVWHLNHSSALPWHRVTSDGSLVLLHVDHSAQGNYSCYDNQGLLLHSVKLRLGRKCCCDLFVLTAPNFSSGVHSVSHCGATAFKMYSLQKTQASFFRVLVPTPSQSLSVQLILWIIQQKRSLGFSHSDILISLWVCSEHTDCVFYHVSLSSLYFCFFLSPFLWMSFFSQHLSTVILMKQW